ncbi:MAG TPA: NAD-dependent epimerase/dehydratase family protein [Thermoanaerobaculia bacterium]|nr:NAD-dependent epimerase/dehydratase family protein [Thermoanaerobaculia bacterium]
MSDGEGRVVLVTGATGLVGSWLVPKLLSRGATVVALVRDADPQSELVRSGAIARCTVVSGRLESLADLERAIVEAEVDTVFHLGAQTIVGTAYRSPLATFEANVRGTYNLLEACRRQSDLVRRIVVASSDKAYGEGRVLPYTEEMPANGRHPYDVSKSCADLIAQTYASTYGLPLAVARCGNIYGGGDLNWSRLIPGTIRSALEGRNPVIRSDGRFTRDYVYVGDAVDAYLSLADGLGREEVRGGVFNFGPGAPATVLEVTQAVLEAAGRTDLVPEIRNEAVAEIREQTLDSAKARRVLGWAPARGLREGLRETVAWYRRYLGHGV